MEKNSISFFQKAEVDFGNKMRPFGAKIFFLKLFLKYMGAWSPSYSRDFFFKSPFKYL